MMVIDRGDLHCHITNLVPIQDNKYLVVPFWEGWVVCASAVRAFRFVEPKEG